MAQTEDQAAALERQYLIDEGYLEEGGTGEATEQMTSEGDPVESGVVPTDESVETEVATERPIATATEELSGDTSTEGGDQAGGTDVATEEPEG